MKVHKRLLTLSLLTMLTALLPTEAAAQVYTVATVDGQEVEEGDVIEGALVCHITSKGPRDLPEISIDASTVRVVQGQLVLQLKNAELYGNLPAAKDKLADAGPLVGGTMEKKKEIAFNIGFGAPPEVKTVTRTTLVPLFPSEANSTLVKITGTLGFLVTQQGLKPLFFAKGASHILRLKPGELVHLDGATRTAAGETEIQLKTDDEGELKITVLKGSLAVVAEANKAPATQSEQK